MKNTTNIALASLLASLFCAGCATPRVPPAPDPIAYLAVKRPDTAIKTSAANPVHKEFQRGKFFIGPLNFRPAPDVASYIEQASQAAGTENLRNADVRIAVPCYVGPVVCGFGVGSKDAVTAVGK